MEELNLLLKYPLMVKYVEGDNIVYKGSVNVHDEDYKITIVQLESNTFKPFLPKELIPFEDLITRSSSSSEKSIVTILDNLCAKIASTMPSKQPINHCDTYKHILTEYAEFTKFYLNLKSCYLASDLGNIDVTMEDERRREHHVQITVNFADNQELFKITSYDLPQDQDMFKVSSNLRVLYDQFVALVGTLQPFFDLMDVFDKNCWILDPTAPERKCNFRRIYLDENLSMVITVDPLNAASIPGIKFLGPERLVEKYRTTLNEHLEEWSFGGDVFSEILKLLGMDSFPEKRTATEHLPELLKENGDCSICFSLRWNGKLPEVVCKNKACENYYHTECLYEWLVSVNARRFFSEVTGQCPNCEKSISCPVPR